jgi:hypothetical protein
MEMKCDNKNMDFKGEFSNILGWIETYGDIIVAGEWIQNFGL